MRAAWQHGRGEGSGGARKERGTRGRDLHSSPVGVFVDQTGKRVSKFYYNLSAAKQWLAAGIGSEPITGQPTHGVLEVPCPDQDLRGWFKAVDVDGNGELTRDEVVEALRALVPLDLKALDAATTDEAMWARFDPDGSGAIDFEELSAKGLHRNACFSILRYLSQATRTPV